MITFSSRRREAEDIAWQRLLGGGPILVALSGPGPNDDGCSLSSALAPSVVARSTLGM